MRRCAERLVRVRPILFCVGGIAGGTWASGACAQEISEPLIIRAPATQQVTAPDAIAVRAGASAVYDTNLLRQNDAGRNDGNLRFTPYVELDLNRLVGRYFFHIGSSLGYDVNTRFHQLDRFRMNLNGSARLPLGGRCAVGPSATYQRYQTDLGDLQVFRGNTTVFQNYTVTISCPKVPGFTPYYSVNQNTGHNSADVRKVLDYKSQGVTGGLSYYRPSLGTISLTGNYRRFTRPNVSDDLGISDSTRVEQFGISIERSVAARLSATAGVSYLNVDPHRAGVRNFSGVAYNADVTYRPVPRLSISAQVDRDARGQSGISATYTIASLYRLSASWALTARSSIDLGLAHDERQFRGEGLIPGFAIRGSDSTNSVTGRYNYDLHRWRFSAFASYRSRDSKNDFFDYHAAAFGISASTRL